jgi:hypothetical protein
MKQPYQFTNSLGTWEVKGGGAHRVKPQNECGGGGRSQPVYKNQKELDNIMKDMELDIDVLNRLEESEVADALQVYLDRLKQL